MPLSRRVASSAPSSFFFLQFQYHGIWQTPKQPEEAALYLKMFQSHYVGIHDAIDAKIKISLIHLKHFPQNIF